MVLPDEGEVLPVLQDLSPLFEDFIVSEPIELSAYTVPGFNEKPFQLKAGKCVQVDDTKRGFDKQLIKVLSANGGDVLETIGTKERPDSRSPEYRMRMVDGLQLYANVKKKDGAMTAGEVVGVRFNRDRKGEAQSIHHYKVSAGNDYLHAKPGDGLILATHQ